jgi:hypothetical protein
VPDGWPHHGAPGYGPGGAPQQPHTPAHAPLPAPYVVTPPTPARLGDVEEGSLAAALLDAARAAPRSRALSPGGAATPRRDGRG